MKISSLMAATQKIEKFADGFLLSGKSASGVLEEDFQQANTILSFRWAGKHDRYLFMLECCRPGQSPNSGQSGCK
jgi:hypothetical protein